MPLASKNVFYAQVQLRPMQYKSQQPAYKPEVVQHEQPQLLKPAIEAIEVARVEEPQV